MMEEEGYLDVDNPLHLWALHLLYLPQLNRELDHFRDSWNDHGLRTVRGNQSPNRIWFSSEQRFNETQ